MSLPLPHEVLGQVRFGNVRGGLPEDRAGRAGVDPPMVGDVKRLARAVGKDATQRYVAATLVYDGETKRREDRDDIVARELAGT